MLNFLKNVFILQIGNYTLALWGFLSSLIVARYLGASDFGKYNLIISISFAISNLCLISSQAAFASFSISFFKKEKDKQIETLSLFLSQSILFHIFLIFLSVFILIVCGFIYSFEVSKYAFFMVISHIYKPFFDIALMLVQIKRKIFLYTLFENFLNLIKLFLIVLCCLLKFPFLGLMIFIILHNFLILLFSCIVYHSQRIKENFPPLIFLIKKGFSQEREKKKEFFYFGLRASLSSYLSNLLNYLPILILSKVYNLSEVGKFSVGFSIYKLYLLLFNAISKNLAIKLPQSIVEGKLKKDYIFSSFGGLCFGFCLFPVVLFLSPFILYLYGKEYTEVCDLFFYFWLLILAHGFGIASGLVFRLLNKIELGMISCILSIAICFPFGIYLINNLAAKGAVIYMFILFALAVVLNFFFCLFVIPKSSRSLSEK